MATEQRYTRDPNGQRFQIGGMNTVAAPDLLPAGRYAFLQNVRAYLQGRITSRATQAAAAFTLPTAVHTLRRLYDSTPDGPASGFAYIAGAGSSLYCNATAVQAGFSGNRLALVPFRPNTSPQPWMYVADSLQMVKVRSDGKVSKTGIKEPQNAPVVGTQSTTVTGNDIVLGTARPWSNVSGANPSFAYGDTGNGTNPVVIDTPVSGATVTLTASGTCDIDGVTVTPGSPGPAGNSNPGRYVTGGAILLGCWTDGNGNIVSTASAPGVFSVGASATLTVPPNVSQLQLGVDGTGGAFAANTGQFAVSYTVATSAVSTVVSLLGSVTAYYWGDSPHSGPVAAYIWKNAADTAGSGPVRSIGDAAGNTTGSSLQFDTTPSGPTAPVQWDILDETGTVTGQNVLFQPALESQGYQDFNVCVTANLFFPSAGDYTFTLTAKDNVMWGIGNNATWPNQNNIRGTAGQTMTVLSKLPLLPSPAIDGGGAATTVSVVVSVPGQGVYPIEANWDYWYHNGRTLEIQVNGQSIPPLSSSVKQNVQYRYVYRGSATGALSNPSPPSPVSAVPAISNEITPEFSTDPQVDKIDYYRMDATLDEFTYAGTGPNANPPPSFTDQLLDADISGNPTLQYDNYEPFPSIDLPRKGVVNVVGGVVQWVSGDQFNPRWLGGTVVNIGGLSYALYNRPSSATEMIAVDAEDGTNLVLEIAEPILAAQPMASMWGTTDNAAYVLGCGDPLRPGVLYWTKGNNLDSAPDTNQQDVTSPSEPLINGVMESGVGMVFSTENGFIIYPSFSNALATSTGVQGSAFSINRSGVTRGLYIRPCICTDGSGTFFYRSKQGIEMCSGTAQQKSITDDDLFNLFPHEGSSPTAVTRAGLTAYPPDDTKPENQRLAFAGGYLYYDYLDATGTPRTLVFDGQAGGWIIDAYGAPVTTHALQEGPGVNGVLTGCADGGVRPLVSGGTEAAQCVVLTAPNNGGDARANKTVGDVFLRASISGNPLAVTPYTAQYGNVVAGASPASFPAGSGLQSYIVDFTDGQARDIPDVALLLSWAAGTGTYLDLWQPDWTSLPETTQDRPTDWTDAGSTGPMFVQGLTLEANTFGQPKTIMVESADDGSLHAPDQNPLIFNGQSKQTLTFTPPFVASSVRIITTDGVPWRYWGAAWAVRPFPPKVVEWQEEMTSLGNEGWQHVREFNIAHISTTDLILTLVFDPGAVPAQMVLTVPNSGGLQAKTKITPGPNKFKLMSRRLSSAQPFRVFAADCEMKVGGWGRQEPYRNIKGFGGESAGGAEV